ncbi:hypothetical protein ABEB36_015289 [Hypothenemus hampei]|uniref:Peptidase A2 domain-containing protein n=1 Tax=Hypothenemus hampei TaxID=57062 RepID=A0ABD1E026_HYPHA
MATANTTIREALIQATDPATPKFVQPPIFPPRYERAAIGNGWNDNYKILYLGQFLEGPAHKWYQRYLSNDANSTKNWETIKQDMKTEFLEGQQGFTSNHFYHKKQRYNEDIKHYYYELQGLADEVDLNMPFPEFLAQFEKGLHPKFRQLYYVLRDNDMHSGSLKVIIQKLHRSQESLSENNYSPTFDYTSSPRFNNNYFRNNQNYSRNNHRILGVKGIVNHKHMDIILDTGAGRSIIREDMVTHVDPLQDQVTLLGAGGARLMVTGTHTAPITFGNVKVYTTLLVAKYLSRPVILGNDFLDTTTAIINYRNKTVNLQFEGNETEFPFTRTGTQAGPVQKGESF